MMKSDMKKQEKIFK